MNMAPPKNRGEVKVHGQEEEELELTGIDEDEIDSYIVKSEYLEVQASKTKREEMIRLVDSELEKMRKSSVNLGLFREQRSPPNVLIAL